MQLEELSTKVDELTAQVDEKDKEVKDKTASHKAELKAMEEKHKMAMDEKDDEKKAMDMDHQKDKEASYKSMKANLIAAMNAEEDDKKKEGMKAALKAMDEDHKKEGKNSDMDNPKEYEKKAEDDKKDREHKAEIIYLTAQIIKPKINQLETLYQASKIPDSEIETFKAEWEKATGPQLDAEISKMIKIVGNVPHTFEAEQRTPFGFSTSRSVRKSQFDASTVHSKYTKMTDSQLFNTSRGSKL